MRFHGTFLSDILVWNHGNPGLKIKQFSGEEKFDSYRRPFYNTSSLHVTWESCSLREWLNGSFVDTAFSPEENETIAETYVTADDNPQYDTDTGNETLDKVFFIECSKCGRIIH